MDHEGDVIGSYAERARAALGRLAYVIDQVSAAVNNQVKNSIRLEDQSEDNAKPASVYAQVQAIFELLPDFTAFGP